MADAQRNRADDPSLTNAPRRRGLLWRLGPGLIAGGADDDPTSIGAYTQAGAALGYSLLWMTWITLPMVATVQEICARIGRITGLGIAANLRRHYSPWILCPAVLLLVIANLINLGADIEAMGEAAKLLIGGPALAYSVGLAGVIVLLQFFGSYQKIETILKLLTLSLLSYVAVAFVVHVQWNSVLAGTFLPRFQSGHRYWSTFVAVLGTTISPYLFFWQSSLETEEIATRPDEQPLKKAPRQSAEQLERIRFDTWVGIGAAGMVSFFIIVAAGATLRAHGLTDVDTLAQAARSLQPIAGKVGTVLFSIGIIGTGLLAVPALSGSAAYAVGGALGWPTGMHRRPARAKGFYFILAAATATALVMSVPALQRATHLSPVKALFWAAVLNGITAAPIMVMVMLMSRSRKVLGESHRLSPWLQTIGWLATAVMAVGTVMLFVA